MRYCSQCGCEINDSAFCPECGASTSLAQTIDSSGVARGSSANPYAHVSALSGDQSLDETDDAIIPTFKGSYARFWTRTSRGRAGRTEFWFVALWHFLIFLPLAAYWALIYLLAELGDSSAVENLLVPMAVIVPVYFVYALLCVVRGVSLFVRRLHDLGSSGWLWPIALVPFVGAIFALIVGLSPSENADNRYGRKPFIKEEKF